MIGCIRNSERRSLALRQPESRNRQRSKHIPPLPTRHARQPENADFNETSPRSQAFLSQNPIPPHINERTTMSNQRLIYGFHAINARLWQTPKSITELYVLENKNDARTREVLEKAAAENVRLHFVDMNRLNTLAKGARHQGVVGFIDASKNHVHLEDVLEHLREPAFLLVLDGITDPHNLGACLRTADAMGVHAVIAPKDKSAGLNATVSKVACGAAETVPYITVTNLARTLRELKEYGIWVVGTDMGGEADLFHYAIPESVAWVMGNEGEGMRRLTREHCDALVSIPMFGTVESMNISVSAGMVMAETRRQRVLREA
jgi:RNA methyltransferase, trmH family, group 3